MQVNNNVLSLTGSLLDDPTNPPPPPVAVVQARAPSPSPSPEPTRPAKQARTSRPAETYEHEPEAVEVVDDRFLNPRELKKKRKDEEKKKRDARKARKEGQALEGVERAAAGDLVGVQGEDTAPSGGSSGVKRKVKDEAEEAEKKRRRLGQ